MTYLVDFIENKMTMKRVVLDADVTRFAMALP
jgi:hypothetical protein